MLRYVWLIGFFTEPEAYSPNDPKIRSQVALIDTSLSRAYIA